MSFRDDLDAAHARLTAVDRENAELREGVEDLTQANATLAEQNAALRDEAERLRAAHTALAPSAPAPAPVVTPTQDAAPRSWRFLLWWIPAAAVTFVATGLMLRYGHDEVAALLGLPAMCALHVAMRKRLG